LGPRAQERDRRRGDLGCTAPREERLESGQPGREVDLVTRRLQALEQRVELAARAGCRGRWERNDPVAGPSGNVPQVCDLPREQQDEAPATAAVATVERVGGS
jgi:hypothetical protein